MLEISSKSREDLGVRLSAFNLSATSKKHNQRFTVETAFQGAKVFEHGGPYTDLIGTDSRAAKRDPRLKASGALTGFRFFGQDFPLTPRTFFYDWLYIKVLSQNPTDAKQLDDYDGFSDIEFNPKKSINCQAHAAALYCSLKANGVLEDALVDPQQFLKLCSEHYARQDQIERIKGQVR